MTDFFLREKSAVDALLALASDNGISINDPDRLREAIQYACSKLPDNWLTLVWVGGENFICRLGQVAWSLPQWAEAIANLYELRDVAGINEQARRLCISSHECFDTSLVITVAGRYKRDGWIIDFEPNGRGCGDLKVSKEMCLYVEVKRENVNAHKRFNNLRANAQAILDAISPTLIDWLEEHDLRVQVKFSRGFSGSLVKRICEELNASVRNAPIRIEQELMANNSQFVVLNRNDEQHFKEGMVSGRVKLKAGVAVQIHPPNMPIQVIFDRRPNPKAIRGLIRDAKRQLQNDLEIDPDAAGLICIQASGGEELATMIEERFLNNLPARCLGVTLLSDIPGGVGHVIYRDGLGEGALKAMSVPG